MTDQINEKRKMFLENMHRLNYLFYLYVLKLPLTQTEQRALKKIFIRSWYVKKITTMDSIDELRLAYSPKEDELSKKPAELKNTFFYHRDADVLTKRSFYYALAALKDKNIIISFGYKQWNHRIPLKRHKHAINIIGFIDFVYNLIPIVWPDIKAEVLNTLQDLRLYFLNYLHQTEPVFCGHFTSFNLGDKKTRKIKRTKKGKVLTLVPKIQEEMIRES